MGALSKIGDGRIETSQCRREQTTPCRRRSHFCLVPINKCLFSPAPSDLRRGTDVSSKLQEMSAKLWRASATCRRCSPSGDKLPQLAGDVSPSDDDLPQLAGDVCQVTVSPRNLQEMFHQVTMVSCNLQEMFHQTTMISCNLQQLTAKTKRAYTVAVSHINI